MSNSQQPSLHNLTKEDLIRSSMMQNRHLVKHYPKYMPCYDEAIKLKNKEYAELEKELRALQTPESLEIRATQIKSFVSSLSLQIKKKGYTSALWTTFPRQHIDVADVLKELSHISEKAAQYEEYFRDLQSTRTADQVEDFLNVNGLSHTNAPTDAP